MERLRGGEQHHLTPVRIFIAIALAVTAVTAPMLDGKREAGVPRKAPQKTLIDPCVESARQQVADACDSPGRKCGKGLRDKLEEEFTATCRQRQAEKPEITPTQ